MHIPPHHSQYAISAAECPRNGCARGSSPANSQAICRSGRACGGRFPLYQTVVLYKFVAHSCGTHKPAVQRIIKHRFVGTPAMRIIVHVLLDAEYLSRHLKLHANLYVERFITGLGIGIIVVLHILTYQARISIDVYHLGNKSRVEILYAIETACKVYHRAQFAVTVDKMQRRHPGSFRHLEVVRTERTCYMHDTCTVFSGHIITGRSRGKRPSPGLTHGRSWR